MEEKIKYRKTTPDVYDGEKVAMLHFDEPALTEQVLTEEFHRETINQYLRWASSKYPEILEEFFKGRKVFEVSIPNFTNSIAVNNKTRVKPYREGYKTPKVPKKYLTPEYDYRGGKLVHLISGEVIPANASKAGMAKIWICNGQEIYNGKIHDHARANYIEKMKNYIKPYIEETPFVTEINLTLEVRFYLLDNAIKKDNKKNIDNINLWIWSKVIGDVMKTLILPDDNPYIIPEDNFKTIFVEDESDTRLEIILWSKE